MKALYDFNNIPKEKFRLADTNRDMSDKKLETKPIGYFHDAWNRFRKNKASVAAAIIILLIVIFAVIVPFVSPYDITFSVNTYKNKVPKNDFLAQFGICTGTTNRELSDVGYMYRLAIGVGAADPEGKGATWADGEANEFNPLIHVGESYMKGVEGREKRYRKADVDVYYEVGFRYIQSTEEEFNKIRAWEAETGKHVIYPMIDRYSDYYPRGNDINGANIWYKVNPNSVKSEPDPIVVTFGGFRTLDYEKDELSDNYLRDEAGNIRYYQNTGKSDRVFRVLYATYYEYLYGFKAQYLFGTDESGYDICVRLATGIRLSLVLSIAVSLINFFIGTIYGAIEGYFGGWTDIIMERISDILSGVPFIIVATLFQMYYSAKVGPIISLLFAFVLTGWLGTAYRVRTQFYRFKNSEYVFAARTLGASNKRLMFKHILPNSLGTIITSSVLVIPGVINSESMLSYLGIASITGDSGTSLGSMLANAQSTFMQYPHLMFFPALVLSLLMISFNLFGNGLRDAFNPSLRGVED